MHAKHDAPFTHPRPRLRDGLAAVKRKGLFIANATGVLATAAIAAWALEETGKMGEGIYPILLVTLIAIAAPLVVYLQQLTLKSVRLKAKGYSLSDRDLDDVVRYAHELGFSPEEMQRVAAASRQHLSYISIGEFLDWIEQQALLSRARIGQPIA